MTEVTIESVLGAAGPRGCTVSQIMQALGASETTVRRQIKALTDDGRAFKVPSMEGQRVVLGPKPPRPAEPTEPRPTHRRVQAAKRDQEVMEMLDAAGDQGLELADIAKRLQVEDIDDKGFSSKTYLSLRRAQRDGTVERIIRWRIAQGEGATAEEVVPS
jgi:hypothetical protein